AVPGLVISVLFSVMYSGISSVADAVVAAVQVAVRRCAITLNAVWQMQLKAPACKLKCLPWFPVKPVLGRGQNPEANLSPVPPVAVTAKCACSRVFSRCSKPVQAVVDAARLFLILATPVAARAV